MSKRLLKSGIIVSGMTLVSRVLGLVRDVVIAHLIGAGAAADVFLFANRIPNFLRRLFAEGAFSQAFVPVLAEYQKSGDLSKTREFIGKVSGTLGGFSQYCHLACYGGITCCGGDLRDGLVYRLAK